MSLKLNNVSKQYKEPHWAIKDISFNLEKGVIGLVGPNGSGKSTLMKMISTLVNATEGEILWENINIKNKPEVIRPILGYLPQKFGFYPNLTAKEFLHYIAAAKKIGYQTAKNKINELLEMVNLLEHQDNLMKTFSGGMIQRVGIAQSLLNDPQLLILDEPMAGLDPSERVNFKNILTTLGSNRIILLSTHIINDVESICSKILLLNHGMLLSNSSPLDLIKKMEGLIFLTTLSEEDISAFEIENVILSKKIIEDKIECRFFSKNKKSLHYPAVVPTLEDVYLYIFYHSSNS